MIKKSYVLVNGRIEDNPLTIVNDADQITFSKNIHDYANTLGVLLVHKPRGVWTNCKQGSHEKEVVDLLPKKYRSFSSIGRLDKASEGLILFTNDGVFANQFLNSGEAHARVYHVWTQRPLTRSFQHQLSSGVMLSDGLTKPCDVREIKHGCYEFRLFEGKNRQIRRMVETCGTHVTRLKRVSFGEYDLGGIVSGQYWFESLAELFKKRLRRVLS